MCSQELLCKVVAEKTHARCAVVITVASAIFPRVTWWKIFNTRNPGVDVTRRIGMWYAVIG
jgi:hypothetical protein